MPLRLYNWASQTGYEEKCSTDDAEIMTFANRRKEQVEFLTGAHHESLLVVRGDENDDDGDLTVDQVEAFAQSYKREGHAIVGASLSANPEEALGIRQQQFENFSVEYSLKYGSHKAGYGIISASALPSFGLPRLLKLRTGSDSVKRKRSLIKSSSESSVWNL